MAAEHFYFPPFHPSCRCTVVAIRDIQAYVAEHASEESPEAENLEAVYSGLEPQSFSMDQDGQLIQSPASLPQFTGFASVPSAMEHYQQVMPQILIDLDDLEEDQSLAVLDQFEHLRQKFPAAAAMLLTIGIRQGKKGAGTLNALSWVTDDGSALVLNKRFWQDAEKLAEVVHENRKHGVFSRTKASPESHIVTHEYGHFLYSALGDSQRRAVLDLFSRYGGKGLSLVAAQDASEMFAEAFVVLQLGGPGTRVTEAIAEILQSGESVAKSSVAEFLRQRVMKRRKKCSPWN